MSRNYGYNHLKRSARGARTAQKKLSKFKIISLFALIAAFFYVINLNISTNPPEVKNTIIDITDKLIAK